MSVFSELKDYISKARSANMSDAEIRSELIRVGWRTKDIDEAILPPPPPRLPMVQPNLAPSVPTQKPPVVVKEGKVEIPKETPKTEPPQALPPKKRHNRIPFVVAVFLVVLLGGAVYYALPQIIDKIEGISLPVAPIEDSLDLEQEVLPLDETISWQTYRNEEFGFEFKYSTVWEKVDVEEYTSRTYHVFVKSTDKDQYLLDNQTPAAREGDARAVLGMDVKFSAWIESVPEMVQRVKLEKGYSGTQVNEEIIGDNTATRIFTNERFGGGSVDSYIFSNGKNAVSLSALYKGTEPGGELNEIFQEVVQSFKFLPQATSTTP